MKYCSNLKSKMKEAISFKRIRISKFLYCNVIVNFIITWQISYNTLLHFGSVIPTDVPGYISQAKSLDVVTSAHQSYRIGVPIIANIINNIIDSIPGLKTLSALTLKSDFSYYLSFYIFNVFLSTLVFILLYLILQELNCNKYISLILIYSLQLSTTYQAMISLANVDLIVIFFICIQIYISLKLIHLKHVFSLAFLVSLISIFFKEYIFLAVFPSIVILLKSKYKSILTKLSLLAFYLISISSSIVLYRKIFDLITYPNSEYKYVNYVKGDLTYMLEKLITPSFNLNTVQNFIQFSPVLLVFILMVSLLSKNFRSYAINKYIYSILPFFIFIALSGVATYPIRVFFPYYIYIILILPSSPLFEPKNNKLINLK